jgi:hypothetical protein
LRGIGRRQLALGETAPRWRLRANAIRQCAHDGDGVVGFLSAEDLGRGPAQRQVLGFAHGREPDFRGILLLLRGVRGADGDWQQCHRHLQRENALHVS